MAQILNQTVQLRKIKKKQKEDENSTLGIRSCLDCLQDRFVDFPNWEA